MTEGVSIELVATPKVSFALEQCAIPIIRSVSIRNGTADPIAQGLFTVQLLPDLGNPVRQGLPLVEPGAVVDLGAIDLRLPPGRLREVVEAERAQLMWSLSEGASELARGAIDVDVTPFHHWPGLAMAPELLAAFVTPNHPVVTEVLRRARERLRARTGDAAFDGYQSGSPARVREMAVALYETVQALGITYAEVPASFERIGQKVRLPDQLLADQIGCCLDLTVFFAACFEQIGLAPLLVLVHGHAFPALWLTDDRFPEGNVTDAARVRNQLALEQILAFDSSTAVMTPRRGFDEAVATATRILGDDARFHCAVDVGVVRRHGFRPLPLRAVQAPEPPPAGATPELVVTRQILTEAARRPPATTAQTTEPPVPVAARFRRWQDRLLDLTLRNKLLNYRPAGTGSIPLLVPDLPLFEDLLASERDLDIEPMAELAARSLQDSRIAAERLVPAEIRAHLASDLRGGTVKAACGPAELGSRYKNLARAARAALEEGGANTLFVAIGLLRWREAPESEGRLAPLLLYPVELTWDRQRGRAKVRRLPDDPIFNVTLIEKVRREHGIDLSGLQAIEADDSGLDIAAVLHATRLAIQARSGWEVLEEGHIGLFTFQKFLMWKDLEENAATFLQNEVVRHVAETGYRFTPAGREVTPDELDASLSPSELPCVMDADSTQMAAIASVLTGRSMVLQGPPGTGKSQTITNLIATALARGNTVLFVSEKMAALEVVHRRLEAVGLGDFCLELHSHKSNKKDVLASFGRAFERTERAEMPAWDAHSRELGELRGSLNRYADALHRARPIGLTFYEAENQLADLGGAPTVRCRIDGVQRWTAAELAAAREAVAELAARAATVEPVDRHPWADAEPASWSARTDEELRDAHAECLRALADVESAAARLQLPEPMSTAALGALPELSALASGGPIPLSSLGPDWAAVRDRIESHIAARRQDAAGRQALALRWQPELLDRDLGPLRARFERWVGAFFLFAWWFLRGARRQLASASRGPLPHSRQILADLGDGERIRASATALTTADADIAQILHGLWPPSAGIDALTALRARGQAAHAVAARLDEPGRLALARLMARRNPLTEAARPLATAVARLTDAERRLVATAGLMPGALWPTANAENHRAGLRSALERLAPALPSFRAWAHYRVAARRAYELGLGALVDAHRRGETLARDLQLLFERNAWSQVTGAIRDAEPALASFDGQAHHRLVDRFAARDREHTSIARAWALAQLDSRLPGRGAGTAETSEPAILGRELRKKTRHLPIRRLLSAIPNLLPRLKPCVLMSPMSVAQYLPAGGKRFDLVVFDEASQIGTHDAIGAIARGAQVVVVGDSRQLPPTSFFSRKLDMEDEEIDENDQEELESVLEEALAKGLPQQMLGWHYRSRHDSLIEFSNQHFYGGKLHVFPGAARFVEELGVTWHHVSDGVYHGGSSREHPRTNPREAEEVVGRLVASLRQHPPGTRTFGVVTFGIAQQTLIQDLLDAARERFPEIDGHFDGDESVFVKNLENVQGDERDEILFSVGYAKDEHGKLRMHFGPLSIAGGERRLNVAITRARCQLRVFSTMTPDQIDLRRTGADGARLLRQFLEFAIRHGRREEVEAAARAHRPAGAIELGIMQAIEALGLEVHPNVGSGGYRIDLGVVDPNRKGVYLLGVECDGPSYASARTARDRDRLRTQVLAALGWRSHRIWSPDWLGDRQNELKRLEEAIRSALRSAHEAAARPTPAPPAPVPRRVDKSEPRRSASPAPVSRRNTPAPLASSRRNTPAPRPAAPTYIKADLPPASDDPQSLYLPSSRPLIRERVAMAAFTESPVHIDELARRVIACFGLQKLTAKSRGVVEQALGALRAEKVVQLQGEFVWHSRHAPASYTEFRLPTDGEARDPELIAPEEIACAAAHVLAQNLSLARADLARETARLFGVTRLGKNVAASIEAALGLLVARGACVFEADRVVWNGSTVSSPATRFGPEPRRIDRNQDVVVIQVESRVGADVMGVDGEAMATMAVLQCFTEAARSHPLDHPWLAFVADGRPHYAGLNLWIGLSKSVPLSVLSLLQDYIEALGSRAERETGNAAQSQLMPVAYLDRNAFELLVHADNSIPDTAFGPFLDHTGGRAIVRRWR